ncbi:NSUN5 [Bugula neritina]|uniref:NSUN5 n=1 Tax=Bugula neritina TaxID=10212 RepID=A0A7J7JSG3_BUGNE|nr:NSUN5 [Bugula neritina]
MSVVCECLKYADILNEIIDCCNLISSDKRFKRNKDLALVVLCRYVFGKGLNGCYSTYKKVIESQKSAIHSAVERVKLRHKVTDLRHAVKEADDSPALLDISEDTPTPPSRNLSTEKFVYIDPDIDNLLVLPTNTDLHSSPLLKDGSVVLQDKASCLPAHVLNPSPGSHVIDACAAPGNKTSHLAALLNNTGTITAFELNTKSNVEYILVDPSCSGSGITSRLNSLTDDQHSSSELRLKKLSSFQSVILKKALSFPKVKRVVYSTCSINCQENEQVVQDVLSQVKKDFTIEKILPSWSHRGDTLDGQFPLGEHCIRASPKLHRLLDSF